MGCSTKPENRAPTASFIVTPAAGTPDTIFVFDASGSSDENEETRFLQVRWDWNNDGEWDTIWGHPKKRSHQFSRTGTFTITLEVKDSWNATNSASNEVVVGNAPIPSFTITPEQGTVDTVFVLDASESYHPNEDRTSLQVRWDWIGEGVSYTEWDTVKVTTHQWTEAGEYQVTLQVKSTSGVTAWMAKDLTVVAHNDPPVASFSVMPDSGSVATTFEFDASGCSDIQNPTSVLQIRWDWNGDGIWDTAWSTEKTADYVFNSAGEYAVGLKVMDSIGAVDSTSQIVTVTDAEPTAAFTFTPTTGNVGTWFNFDASASNDPEFPETLELNWDWENDGILDVGWSTVKQLAHQFQQAGLLTVVLVVRDKGGQTDSTSTEIEITNSSPTADFTITPTTGNINTVFIFDASASTDIESHLNLLQVRWDLKGDGIWDGIWTYEKDTWLQFQVAGTYTVRMEVKDPQGLTDIKTMELIVSNTQSVADSSRPKFRTDEANTGRKH